jgi:hypothetical protein
MIVQIIQNPVRTRNPKIRIKQPKKEYRDRGENNLENKRNFK